jgi:hypothetical protein
MLKLKCAKHPRYAGKESPRAACHPCQVLYDVRIRAFEAHLKVVESHSKEHPYDPRQSHSE